MEESSIRSISLITCCISKLIQLLFVLVLDGLGSSGQGLQTFAVEGPAVNRLCAADGCY